MKYYIWEAHQSEPGRNGVTYCATTGKIAPKDIETIPVPGAPNLAYQESFWGEWQFIGWFDGELIGEDRYGTELYRNANREHLWELTDIITCGWYSK